MTSANRMVVLLRFATPAIMAAMPAGCERALVTPASTLAVDVNVASSSLATRRSFDSADNVFLSADFGTDTLESEFPISRGLNEIRGRISLPVLRGGLRATIDVEVREGTEPLFVGSDNFTTVWLVRQPGKQQPVAAQ